MLTIGRRVYGLGAIVLGVPLLIDGTFAVTGFAVPPHLPGYPILLYACAAVLIAAGLAINLERAAAASGLALAVLFALVLAFLDAPLAATQPTFWVSWEDIAEATIKTLGGVLVYLQVATPAGPRAATARRVVRLLFGACLVVFGISEFVYAKFTASLVPDWLPPSRIAWAYVTGAAQIAAGLAILSGVQARLAAVLLTVMYLGFTFLVHIPRVILHPATHGAWAENGTNLVLAGAAWLLAEMLSRDKA
jgi:uncharacterized membrane protein YphA (DoxX/SURF4 family)